MSDKVSVKTAGCSPAAAYVARSDVVVRIHFHVALGQLDWDPWTAKEAAVAACHTAPPAASPESGFPPASDMVLAVEEVAQTQRLSPAKQQRTVFPSLLVMVA